MMISKPELGTGLVHGNRIAEKLFSLVTLSDRTLGGAHNLQSAALGCFSFLYSLARDMKSSEFVHSADTPRTVATVQDLAVTSSYFGTVSDASIEYPVLSASLQLALTRALRSRASEGDAPQ